MKKQAVDLQGKAILVTGSPGFIGSNLVLRLLKELLDLADSQEKFDKSSRSRLDGENAWYEYLSDIMYGQGISLTGLADAHRMSSYITGIAAMY